MKSSKKYYIVVMIIFHCMSFRLLGQVTLTPKATTGPGKADGQIQVTMVGTPPFQVQLFLSGQATSLQTMDSLKASSAIFKNLFQGAYTIMVYHNNGQYLGQANADVGTSELLQAVSEPKVTPVSCFGPGKIEMAVSGGAGDYVFTLTGTKSPIRKTSLTGKVTFDKLSPGTYTLNITDARKSTPVVIRNLVVAPYVPVGGTVIQKTDIQEAGANTGKITIAGKGGQTPYTYALNGDFGNTNATGVFENLSSGKQFIMIKDAIGCMVPVHFTINNPTP